MVTRFFAGVGLGMCSTVPRRWTSFAYLVSQSHADFVVFSFSWEKCPKPRSICNRQVVPTYINEVSPTALRGALGAVFQLACVPCQLQKISESVVGGRVLLDLLDSGMGASCWL